MRKPARWCTKLSADVVALRYILKTTRQDTWSRTLLQFEENLTRYLEYHSVTIWWRLNKIPAVALCYNLMRTRQDTSSGTLLQFDEDSTTYLQSRFLQFYEDSTRYLELHSLTIWWGLDRIRTAALCCNLTRTRQDTCSRALLQFCEDSTRYLEYHSVTIW
jgi:hypothetical protein